MRVLLFDVFGTLVDWRGSLIELAEAAAAQDGLDADWAGIVDDWRRAYQPALDQIRQGAAWRDLDSQLAGSYKPDARVYLTALELLDCRPEDAGMVAAHGSDLQAAAALGLRAIFIRRPLEWGPGVPAANPPALDALLTADGLDDLATALGC